MSDVIRDLCDVTSDIAEDIRTVLAEGCDDNERRKMGYEGAYEQDAHYEESDIKHGDLHFRWESFEKSLKTEARYFSQSARDTLTSIFAGISDLTTWDGKPVVVDYGPAKAVDFFYRARVFQRHQDLVCAMERPDIEVGPPPPASAKAGRMNATGIAVFYGALDAATALAEVRPPVGSHVLVVRFQILRPVRLLDVEALRSVRTRGSMFDPSFTIRLQKAKFLEGLSRRISAPVMPDDEPLEYLPTQAVAEFLAREENPALDGIIYRSVQTGDGALNVVLFHKSSRVEPLSIPAGTTFSTTVHLDIEYTERDPECSVLEQVPPEPSTVPRDYRPIAFWPSVPLTYRGEENDPREFVLKVDITGVELHLVQAARIETYDQRVSRHRFEHSTSGPEPF